MKRPWPSISARPAGSPASHAEASVQPNRRSGLFDRATRRQRPACSSDDGARSLFEHRHDRQVTAAAGVVEGRVPPTVPGGQRHAQRDEGADHVGVSFRGRQVQRRPAIVVADGGLCAAGPSERMLGTDVLRCPCTTVMLASQTAPPPAPGPKPKRPRLDWATALQRTFGAEDVTQRPGLRTPCGQADGRGPRRSHRAGSPAARRRRQRGRDRGVDQQHVWRMLDSRADFARPQVPRSAVGHRLECSLAPWI